MAFGAEVVVRITSDCPLIDSEIVDSVIGEFLKQQADYASNTLERTYPRGLDTEVFSMAALRRAWCEAQELPEREHVTPYLYGHPEQFRLASLTNGNDYHGYRWTLDTPEDLQLIRAIYQRLATATISAGGKLWRSWTGAGIGGYQRAHSAEIVILASDLMAGTLIIRADATPAIGHGHLMRCLALAQAWQDAGGRGRVRSGAASCGARRAPARRADVRGMRHR